MKHPYSILPPFRPPWRYDLYQSLFSALLLNPKAERGEGRAKELYRQAVMIVEKTGEDLSAVVWALATFEHAITQSAAEEVRFPSSHSSPQKKASAYHAFLQKVPPEQPNPSHCSQPSLFG